uniref:NADH-ubiquinone oxidoreductase chain 2 n=1 Tax=Phalangium opilio TaxID=118624 RepID=B2CKY3_PHAOP|nr:NADH dehydrogenase subunit 2 [Phalangium opilio]ACA66078.1 NADH dehydrogenase subunit 2 [Phalangium opilio]
MLMKPSSLSFIMMMLLGTLISISATSWFPIWLGMEMNIIGFIPLIINKKNILTSESALSYFTIQSVSSSALLLFSIQNNFFMLSTDIITIALLTKLGAAPFHFWVPSITENISWNMMTLLLTWQKFAPLMILNIHNKMSNLIMLTLISSAIWGSLGGLFQTSTSKMLAFSSIAHMGWLISATMCSTNMVMMYFLIYSLSLIFASMTMKSLKMNSINSTLFTTKKNKILIYTLMLNMGGMPPLLGFFPKLMVLSMLLKLDWMILSMILIMSAMMNLFFYIRLSYVALMLNSFSKKNIFQISSSYSPYFIIILLSGPVINMFY